MVINANRIEEFNGYARYAVAHKDAYQEVTDYTGVKWYHVAVIHRREADGNFNAYLGNGQPLSERTTEVPQGRGPFTSFRAGAIDALRFDGLTNVLDWRLEKILYYCELFNGTGYDNRGLPSPYLWGGTNVQKPGKYVSDRRFNSRVFDSQPGCAPMLRQIAELDSSVSYVRET